jgi:hypothetical protein
MLTLELEPAQDARLIFVQEEPALEIALPQVFDQPPLTTLQRGKLANVEGLIATLYRNTQANPQGGFGPEYQELVTEFAPLFTWVTACWDYVLSTEGCRFIPRNGEQKNGARGDYRVVTDKDYSRMVHAIFRSCVLAFAQTPQAPSLSAWLRPRFWPLVLEAYRRLEQPADPRQRTLTPYSYLRCIPYAFLNDYHHELVYRTVEQLPERARRALDLYFFHFYTEAATAEALGSGLEEAAALLRQGLIPLLVNHRLVYCLLRQIERY